MSVPLNNANTIHDRLIENNKDEAQDEGFKSLIIIMAYGS